MSVVQQHIGPPTAMVKPLLITVDELSEILGISPRSIWRQLSSGQMIKPIRIGGSVRWRLTEVEEWVAAGCPEVSGWRK
jgi:excisionase family DNA binding protein